MLRPYPRIGTKQDKAVEILVLKTAHIHFRGLLYLLKWARKSRKSIVIRWYLDPRVMTAGQISPPPMLAIVAVSYSYNPPMPKK